MKYLLSLFLLALPLTASAQATIYNYFSPGCALAGNASSQTVNLSSGSCIVGNLSVNNLNGGTGASASTYFSGAGTWTTPSGAPGGSNQQVQVNNSGVFAGYPNFTWTSSNNSLYVGYSTSSTNGNLVIGGTGTGVGTVRGGAELDLAGDPLVLYTTGGGAINVAGSAGTGAGTGTSISITAGNTGATSTSPGGAVTLTGGVGNASAASGGQVTLVGGSGYSTTGTAGNVSIQGGLGNNQSLSGKVNVLTNNTTRVTIPSQGGMNIVAPSYGSALTVNGAAANDTIIVNSGSTSSQAAADLVVTRAGSTANQVVEGPNIQLYDTTNAGLTTLQNSGGQTELWQYNGGWNQIFNVGTTRGMTLNAPVSGNNALTITGASNASTAELIGGSATGASYGETIVAGTNASDYGFSVANRANTSQQFLVRGDGGVIVGNPSAGYDEGPGTINAQGLYVNGAKIPRTAYGVCGSEGALSTGNQTSGIASCSTSGTGLYTVNLSPAFTTVPPVCTGGFIGNLYGEIVAINTNTVSVSVYTSDSTGGHPSNGAFNIICVGL